MGAIVGIGYISNQLTKSQSSAKKTTAVEGVVTAVLAALNRESGFVDPDGTLSEYNEATLQNFELNYFGTQLAEKRGGVWIPKFFNSEGQSCDPGPLEFDCNIRVDFELIIPPGASTPKWSADYNVSIVENPTGAIPIRLASNPSTISISRKFTSQRTDKTKCDFDEVLMRGYDAAGNAECWSEALAGCASDEFVTGYRFQGATGELQPICQKMRGIQCADQHFVFKTINPTYLQTSTPFNGAQAGDCVYISQETISAGHPQAPTHPQKCPVPAYEESAGKCVLNPTLRATKAPVQKL